MTRRRFAVLALVVLAALAVAAIWQWPHDRVQAGPTDQALFDRWAGGSEAGELARFQSFLAREGVVDVVPLAELLRSDVRWRRCDLPPFAVPPRARWRDIVPTLRFLRDHVEPVIGPLRVVSAFRDPAANRCLGGASASRHLRFAALDLEPMQRLSRDDLIDRMCRLHKQTGARFAVGLGIYKGTRFHIDTSGFRRWGSDFRAATSPCLNNN